MYVLQYVGYFGGNIHLERYIEYLWRGTWDIFGRGTQDILGGFHLNQEDMIQWQGLADIGQPHTHSTALVSSSRLPAVNRSQLSMSVWTVHKVPLGPCCHLTWKDHLEKRNPAISRLVQGYPRITQQVTYPGLLKVILGYPGISRDRTRVLGYARIRFL